jgi:hypothetical protein
VHPTCPNAVGARLGAKDFDCDKRGPTSSQAVRPEEVEGDMFTGIWPAVNRHLRDTRGVISGAVVLLAFHSDPVRFRRIIRSRSCRRNPGQGSGQPPAGLDALFKSICSQTNSGYRTATAEDLAIDRKDSRAGTGRASITGNGSSPRGPKCGPRVPRACRPEGGQAWSNGLTSHNFPAYRCSGRAFH